MTVFENVAFGLYGQNKNHIAKRVSELLVLTGLNGMDKKYPHELSGGQRQRVALARSLAPAPKVMLLDEPFSNLDAELRESLRNETKQILKESDTTVILVTHDQEEAFSLSDRVGLLNAGRLEQMGTPYEVYHNPASRFVADFVGKADFIPAFTDGDYVVSSIGKFPNNKDYCLNASKVDLMIRPDDVTIEADPNGEALIYDMRFLGSDVLYKLRLSDNVFIHSIGLSAFPIPTGTKVKVSINMPHTVCFPSLD
jgi:iron(III) transport system ATP-binding protein